MRRREWMLGVAAGVAAPHAARAQPHRADGVLRLAFVAAETGFDPARVGDLYSSMVLAHLFEAPYAYDPLAFPVKPRPLTAATMPEHSDDFREWVVRLKPGTLFTDDPAFGGKPRELVAADYAYSFKRMYDPAVSSPAYAGLQEDGILGLQDLREGALKERRPFDYDSEVEGLRAIDRYTLRIRLANPRPRFIHTLCDSSTYGAVAREVIERYGADAPAHPVGTGPYRLGEWRRSSRIVLERNPQFRDMRYDGEPAPDDAQGQAWLARLKGRRLPLNERVEIAVIEESQPRWLAFLKGEIDFVRVPLEFTFHGVPNGKLAPNLAKRGITMRRYVNPDFVMSWFNMQDPVVGGLSPQKVALRRAIQLAYDIDREINYVRRGQAMRAQSPVPPGTYGYDASFRSANAEYDLPRAKALLDLYGYVDRDGDGWRELPDGSPLQLVMATQSSSIERQLDEVWQKSMDALGVRLRFEVAQWPENMKAARAGRLQMWSLGSTATQPDPQQAFEYMFGPSIGSQNIARAQLPGFDDLYRRSLNLPDSPQRASLFREMSNLVAAYMPYRSHVHRVYNDVVQPWINGWRQPLFRNEVWQYVEVDDELRSRMTR